jgi:kynurenine formamidase
MKLSSLYLVTCFLSTVFILSSCQTEQQLAEDDSWPPLPQKIIDLSPVITEDLTLRVRGEQQISSTSFDGTTQFDHRTSDGPLYVLNSFITLYDHAGPHNDAPNHLIPGGKSTEELPLDSFFGPARIFDFRDRPNDEPLIREDFETGEIRPGEIVIVAVGYEAPTVPDELPSYPYLSGEAAEYLASIPVKAFASDMPSTGSFRRYGKLMEESIDPYHVVPEHLAFLSREIPNIEGLSGLHQLVGEENVIFVGFPLKVQGASGGMMRAVALIY